VADLSLLGALGYAAAGGAGAAVLAMVGPMLMEQYASSSSDAGMAEAQFAFLIEAVGRGVWQLFDGIGLAAWWFGIGILLRGEHLGLARLSLALAAVGIVGVLFNVLGIGLMRDLVLIVVFGLWTAWWVWLLVVLRRPQSS
jgi:hypothetical protein